MIARIAKFAQNRWHPLWRLRRLAVYRWLQPRLDRTIYTRIPGTGIRVAIKLLRDASWVFTPANLEPQIRTAFALVLELLRPGVFWDIGANIGFYSWIIRQHPAVHEVVMFEPDPTNFALITSTIRRNAIGNCRAVNVAVSDRCGEARFLLDRVSGATGSLAVLARHSNTQSLHHDYQVSETISVTTVTIDSVIASGSAPPNLIKIDAEGAESLVLAGARACLRADAPTLIVETRETEVLECLGDLGYKAFRIDADNVLFISARTGVDFSRIARTFPECDLAGSAANC